MAREIIRCQADGRREGEGDCGGATNGDAQGRREAGITPEGWSNLCLRDVIKLASGDSRPRDVGKDLGSSHQFPVYGGNGVLGYSSSNNSAVSDIIIGRVGEYCGVTRFVEGPKWITDNALYAKHVDESVDREFLALRLQLFDLSKVRSKGGQPLVSQEPIYGLQFSFPPVSEQLEIVLMARTWDRAIETVEALIANALEQKAALTKALLTARARLPGFSGDWMTKSLDDLFQFKRGRGLSKSVVGEGANPCILYGELYTRYPEVVREVIGRTDAKDGELSEAGDVLIPGSTTTSGIDLANATALLRSGILLGGDINILRPKEQEQSAPFFAYLLTHAMKAEIASRAQGVTIIHLYGSDLKTIEVSVPTHPEQHAIAQFCMEVDARIIGLGMQLAALRKEKFALMQQLLTGKRRVRLDKAEAA